MNIVITGANRGIGLEFCRYYKKQGASVIGVCRQSSPDLEQCANKVISNIDVANAESIGRLQEAVGKNRNDILINNAGILRNETLTDMNFDTIQQQFEVNTLGPLRVSHALQNNLQNGSKVALITSRMGSIADNTSGSRYGYRMSKAALNIAGVSLAHDLKACGIAVAILHPGYVQTDMVGGRGDITPVEAAQRLAQRIAELNLENSGTFWHSNGEVLPW